MRALALAFVLATGCVRAPAPVDVAALVAKRGPANARLELAIRVIDHPRDIAARLALAELAEQQHRPSEAIEQLETVEHLGGPLGTRWHASDRARLGRLLLARGRARTARGSASALADLERAAALGASIPPDALRAARVAAAVALLRHVDENVRARGRTLLAEVDPRARPTTPRDHGVLGAWLWTLDARREAYAELAVWHDATPAPRDEILQAAYLRAVAWWSPLWLGEVPPPPPEDLVGPERCVFPGADCTPPTIDTPTLPPLDAPLNAAARYAATRPFASAAPAELAAIAAAHAHDPSVGERLGRDLVARATDVAAGQATLGALYDALGDRPRARTAWQAAVAATPDPVFVRGLAEAAARAGDGPAALVFATSAAAACGDPAVVWNAVAAALLEAQLVPDALTALRMALDLAGPDELGRALDLAIEGSRAMGRDGQVSALQQQRAQLAIARTTSIQAAGTQLQAALAAHRERPTAATLARVWVASREAPRDVDARVVLRDELEASDPRRTVIERELLELAGDPDPTRAMAAARALSR